MFTFDDKIVYRSTKHFVKVTGKREEMEDFSQCTDIRIRIPTMMRLEDHNGGPSTLTITGASVLSVSVMYRRKPHLSHI